MIPPRLMHAMQRLSRRLDVGALERVHQASYLELSRRTPWLVDPPLASTNGGTANFSLLFVLLSVLRSGIGAVLELGAGHSTRLLAQWASATGGTAWTVDHDRAWLERVAEGKPGVTAVHAPLTTIVAAGRQVQWYDTRRPDRRFDLLLVDGPPAWTRPHRFDRLGVLTWLPEVLADDFVVVVDDASRCGERELVRELQRRLGAHGTARRDVTGWSSQTIFATPRFASSLYL